MNLKKYNMVKCSYCTNSAISSCKDCNIELCKEHKREHVDLDGDHSFKTIELRIHPKKYSELAAEVNYRISVLQKIKGEITKSTSSMISRVKSNMCQMFAGIDAQIKKYTLLLDTSHLTSDKLKSINTFLDTIFSPIPLQAPRLIEINNFHSQILYKETTETPEFDSVQSAQSYISATYQYYLDQGTGIDKIAITADGATAVVAYSDFSIKIFNLKSRKEKATLFGHTDRIYKIVITPDSKFALTAGADKIVRVWDIANKKLYSALAGHSDKIFCIAVTRDCKKAITGGSDLNVFVWDLELKCLEFTLSGHSAYIYNLLVTRDGKFAVSCGGDGTVRVWKLKTRKVVAVMFGRDQCEGWIERYSQIGRLF